MKFLVALQYWDGDRDAAHRLMKFIPHITEHKNPYADIVIFHRFDAARPDQDIVDALKRSFENVYVIKGKHQLIGHPDGCNGLWGNLVETAYRKHTETATSKPPEWSQYKAVLAIESDSFPISRDWLRVLSAEWDRHKCVFMGHFLNSNADHPELGHINGNAMFAIDLFRRIPGITGTPCGRAWDTYHAKKLSQAGWANTGAIVSIWNTPTIAEQAIESLTKIRCVLLHGVKDNSVIEIMQRRLQNETVGLAA